MAEPFDTLAQLAPELGTGVLTFFLIILVLVFISIGTFFWVTKIAQKVSFEGEEICRMRITIQGKYTLEGNLSKNDSFDEEKLDELKEKAELKVIVGIIEQLKKIGKLFIYNFKVTDDTDATDEFAKKTRIISPNKLESDTYSTPSQRGKRFFTNPFQSQARRNCIFVHTTRRVTIINEDKQEEDWWFACPLPIVEQGMYNYLKDNPFPNEPVHYYNIENIQGSKAIAEYASATTTLTKALQANKHVVKERNAYEKLYNQILDKLEISEMEKNSLEEEVSQKKYVDTGREEWLKKQKENFAWSILSGVAVFVGVVAIPDAFPNYPYTTMQIIGMAIGLAMTGIIFKFFTDKQKDITKQRVEPA